MLEKLANVATIVLAVVATVVAVGRFLPERPAASDGYEIGQRLVLKISTEPKALVMVTRSGCRFCDDSMPVYREVLTAAKRKGVKVVAVSVEPEQQHRQYLAQNGVFPDLFADYEVTGLRVRGTPTTLLIKRGRLIAMWRGRLSPSQQAEIVAAL